MRSRNVGLRNPRRKKPLFELDGLKISFTGSATLAESIIGSTTTASSAENLTGNLIAAIDFANKSFSKCIDLPSLAFR